MAMSCKGICVTYKAQRLANGFRYDMGQKRCSYCALYLFVDGIKCPCCGARLRSKARHRTNTKSLD